MGISQKRQKVLSVLHILSREGKGPDLNPAKTLGIHPAKLKHQQGKFITLEPEKEPISSV